MGGRRPLTLCAARFETREFFRAATIGSGFPGSPAERPAPGSRGSDGQPGCAFEHLRHR